MNWVHIHLLLNHVPVLATLFGLVLLAVAVVKNSEELKRVSFAVFVITAIVALPVYFTGEPAEEAVEHLPGVSESLIERHEEAAQLAFIAVEILGIVALVGLALFRHAQSTPHRFSIASLGLAIVTGGMMAWTANLGGQIRHSEIRAEQQLGTPPALGGENDEEEEHEGRQAFGEQTVKFTIPRPLKVEHEELHAALAKATKFRQRGGIRVAAAWTPASVSNRGSHAGDGTRPRHD